MNREYPGTRPAKYPLRSLRSLRLCENFPGNIRGLTLLHAFTQLGFTELYRSQHLPGIGESHVGLFLQRLVDHLYKSCRQRQVFQLRLVIDNILLQLRQVVTGKRLDGR